MARIGVPCFVQGDMCGQEFFVAACVMRGGDDEFARVRYRTGKVKLVHWHRVRDPKRPERLFNREALGTSGSAARREQGVDPSRPKSDSVP